MAPKQVSSKILRMMFLAFLLRTAPTDNCNHMRLIACKPIVM